MRSVQIDGSEGEGGGQILRTALSLATLLRQPVTIENIRAKRQRPGLMPQHLTGIRALAEICDATLSGAELYSQRLTFKPRNIKGGRYCFDIKTAGAATMVIAAILPPLLFAACASEIIISGGTHVPFSPPYHYLAEVFLPALAQMGANVEVAIERWGWYPKGGGRIRLRVQPIKKMHNIMRLERGKMIGLHFLFGLSNLPFHIVEREQKTVQEILAAERAAIFCRVEEQPALGGGNMIFLRAEFEKTRAGFSVLGRKGWPAENVAAELCAKWQEFSKTAAVIDTHLSDQILLYMVLAHGESSFRTEKISSHLLTNLSVVNRLLPFQYELDEKNGSLRVQGRGYGA